MQTGKLVLFCLLFLMMHLKVKCCRRPSVQLLVLYKTPTLDDACQPRINFFHVNIIHSLFVILIRLVRYLHQPSTLGRKSSQFLLQTGEHKDDLIFLKSHLKPPQKINSGA